MFATHILKLGAVFCLFNLGAYARDADPRLETYGRISRFSPVEAAGSHGSAGFVIGAGVRDSSMPLPQIVEGQTDDKGTNRGFETRQRWGEFFLTKGLTWPIDFGVGFAKPSSGPLQRFSGYGQWTVYEELAKPALAVRTSYSKVFGFGGNMFAAGAQALASWGFLSYFTLYGGVGGDYIDAELDNPSTIEQQLSLSPTGEPYSGKDQWVEGSRFYGMRILLLPPSGTLTAEADSRGNEEPSYIVKMAFGM